MKILAIADEESAYLWDYFEKSKLEGIDLIISCGDLNPKYLSFLATFTSAPVIYVHGNHDRKYKQTPPEGCICIEDEIYVYKGVRILGLGGSMKYNSDECQYTEREMRKRVKKLRFKLWWHRGFDILLTHSPAYQLGDDTDLAHTGFDVFNKLIDKYHPKLLVHGHVHQNYQHNFKRIRQRGDTQAINAFCSYVIEIDD